MSDESTRHRSVRIRPRRQVPVLISDTMTECGAACLAMVLGYFGRRATVEECAKLCFVGRDGASALSVATAARSYGLRVTPCRVEQLDDLAQIGRPAILFWGFNHFVVLERFRGADAVIVDPARGRIFVERQELDENFTGVALPMAPGPEFRPGGARPASPGWIMAKRVLRAPGIGPLITKVVLASLLLIGLGVIGPWVITIIVDQVVPTGQRVTLQVIAVGVGLVLLCRSLVSLVRGLLLVDIQNEVDRTLSTSFFDHLLRLPYSFFERHSVGDLQSRLAANSQMRMVLTQNTLSGALDGILVVVYAAVLFAASPAFGLAAAGFGVVQILLVVIPARRITQLTVTELAEGGKTSGFAAEALRGIDSVKAAGSEAWAFSRWHSLYERQLTTGMRRARLTAVLSVAATAVADASTLVLPLLAGWQALSGTYSVGAMIGLVALAANLSQPLTRLAVTVQQLQGVQGHLRRLATILTTTVEQAPATCRPAPTLTGHIDLHNVGLRHPGASSWALRHITLTIPAGARVAFVGPSGSGKSTLVKMILGFYPPSEGRVLLDGHDLRDLDLGTVRRQCGVVPQEVVVFNGTIRRNIAFGNPDLSFAEVRRAAQLADLERDIATMPMGYETIISENGSTLSGGQRQRLALARALAGQPAILILDEATSALDTITETTIANNLVHAGITTITVTHRLSTIRRADTIVVLSNGGIAEIGDHNTLIAAPGGLYAAMATGAETAV
ncbi:ATP-binding cassette domain-containing protein [Nocardia sp. R6R-6]|uniref:ATP-binding cassette domain-containing protein n=1 Tax=Nocardia sp. R6R-6 TaxID=3459303 RepID=UPI00403D5E6B